MNEHDKEKKEYKKRFQMELLKMKNIIYEKNYLKSYKKDRNHREKKISEFKCVAQRPSQKNICETNIKCVSYL